MHRGTRYEPLDELVSPAQLAAVTVQSILPLCAHEKNSSSVRMDGAAGMREVDMLPVLRDELLGYKAGRRAAGPDDLVFTTATGARRHKDNARTRVLAPAVKKADELLTDQDLQPLPAGVTPHKLRHTFCSILVALGKDPAYVMGQLGHSDPKFTLRVYTHAMRRGDDERARLRALVEGRPLAGERPDIVLDDRDRVAVDRSLHKRDRVDGAGGAQEHGVALDAGQAVPRDPGDVGAVEGGGDVVCPRSAEEDSPHRGLDHAPEDTPSDWAEVGRKRETAPGEGAESSDGRGGFRTCDLSRVKRALSH
jgi:hypothetical protein